jgi:hypothetical protein
MRTWASVFSTKRAIAWASLSAVQAFRRGLTIYAHDLRRHSPGTPPLRIQMA